MSAAASMPAKPGPAPERGPRFPLNGPFSGKEPTEWTIQGNLAANASADGLRGGAGVARAAQADTVGARSDAGVAPAGAGLARAGADVARSDAGVARVDAGVARAGAGLAQAGAGTAQADAGVVQAGVDVASPGAGLAQAGAGTAQAVAGVASPGRARQLAGSEGAQGSVAGAQGRAGGALAKAATLIEALPWLERFHGQTVVIKYGGNAMTDEALRLAFAQDVVFLRYAGLRPVVVHGGGPQISAHLARLGVESTFTAGL